MSFHAPEEYRLKEGPQKSAAWMGNNGAFMFKALGVNLMAIASNQIGWEHVSVTRQDKKIPSWNIMCYVKDMFWDDDDVVVQFHPAKKDYVNTHPGCLHLWRPTDREVHSPPTWMVGPKQ